MEKNKNFHTVRGYQLILQEKNALTPAMEDYLEMIYRNSLETGLLRVNMLSGLLNVHPSSVTKMIQRLSRFGFVNYQKYGIILPTEKGLLIGEFLYKRHQILESFLRLIGNSDNLLTETELIEHHISSETLVNIELFNQFFADNPELEEKFNLYKKEFRGMNQ